MVSVRGGGPPARPASRPPKRPAVFMPVRRGPLNKRWRWPSTEPFLEVGSYCGKSAIYLGAAARDGGGSLFAVDHHRGSEENQPGWEWHEPDLVDPEFGKMDTLPVFRRTIHDAGLEGGPSWRWWAARRRRRRLGRPLALLFIDGGHGVEPARDYALWTPHVAPGGTLVIHDVHRPGRRRPPAYEQIYQGWHWLIVTDPEKKADRRDGTVRNAFKAGLREPE